MEIRIYKKNLQKKYTTLL